MTKEEIRLEKEWGAQKREYDYVQDIKQIQGELKTETERPE